MQPDSPRTASGPGSTVLVTNDDGPTAPGLAALVEAAATAQDHPVTVAVPAVDVSSTGTALGAVDGRRVDAWPSDRRWPGSAAGFEIMEQPSTIVTLAAFGAFGPPPAFVLAGINHGNNIGWGLIHSSTVGAALTAAVHRTPAVAFAAPSTADWSAWRPTLIRLIQALPDEWPVGTVVSVNLPARPAVGGVEAVWCGPAESTATGGVGRITTGAGRLAFRLTYESHDRVAADTDAAVVASGRVALTPLSLPFTGPIDPAWQTQLLRRFDAGSATV